MHLFGPCNLPTSLGPAPIPRIEFCPPFNPPPRQPFTTGGTPNKSSKRKVFIQPFVRRGFSIQSLAHLLKQFFGHEGIVIAFGLNSV